MVEHRTGASPAADWAACEAITRRHGRSFYLACRCLPPAARRAAHATYAFCRIADDLVDAAPGGSEATEAALGRWAAEIERPRDPVARAFAEARARFAIPAQPVYDLLTGIRMDLTPRRYGTWAELRGYCYHVAGTVGLMVAPILGCRDPRALMHATELGIAMQLTNIVRDVAEDAAAGRLYLPLDEIAAFGCDPEAILGGRPSGRFSELIAFQIDRARALYAIAERGIPALSPSGRLTTLMASRLYAGILGEIEAQGYDVFARRARVSTAAKLCTLPGIAGSLLGWSLGTGLGASPKSPDPEPLAASTLVTPHPEFPSYG